MGFFGAGLGLGFLAIITACYNLPKYTPLARDKGYLAGIGKMGLGDGDRLWYLRES